MSRNHDGRVCARNRHYIGVVSYYRSMEATQMSEQTTIQPRATSICAFRAGRKSGRNIRFVVEYLISEDPAEQLADPETDNKPHCVRSQEFATFEAANAFAETMLGPDGLPKATGIRLMLGGLGIAHATSRAGFPKRGADVLSASERDMLKTFGFAVDGVEVVSLPELRSR